MPNIDQPLTAPPADSSHPLAPARREPRQERGQRRFDEILDAAEALVEEVGPLACSIQELARRAGASVGSIYHFFPTKDAIFEALRARHLLAAQQMAAAIRANAGQWARLPLDGFVRELLAPLSDLLEHSPSMFALERTLGVQRDAATEAALHDALLHALSRRWPDVPTEVLEIRTRVMHAIGEGVTRLMMHESGAPRAALLAELYRAEYGYLATFDAEG